MGQLTKSEKPGKWTLPILQTPIDPTLDESKVRDLPMGVRESRTTRSLGPEKGKSEPPFHVIRRSASISWPARTGRSGSLNLLSAAICLPRRWMSISEETASKLHWRTKQGQKQRPSNSDTNPLQTQNRTIPAYGAWSHRYQNGNESELMKVPPMSKLHYILRSANKQNRGLICWSNW